MEAAITQRLKAAVASKKQEATRKRLKTGAAPFPAELDPKGVPRPDFSRIPARLDKREAARFVTQFYFAVSFRSLERWPLPWIVLNGKRTRSVVELDAYCRSKIAGSAPGWAAKPPKN